MVGPATPLTPRAELVAIQREAVTRLERELSSAVLERPALRRYASEYAHEFAGPFAASSREELLRTATNADVIYVGDYHTLEAAQRSFLWLVSEVRARRGEVAIALEMLEPRDQPAIDAFLAGAIDERTFLALVRYAERWGFSWKHYRPILAFAKRTGTRVFGIDRAPGEKRASLVLRDRFAAKAIAEALVERPATPVLVLVGDLHLAGTHLPARVASRLDELGCSRRSVTVFQNSEELYWRLVTLQREQTAVVVRLDESRFCLMGATPLAKVRSYFDWARRAGEPLRFPGLGWREDEEELEEVGKLVAEFFGVPAGEPPRRPGSPDPVLEAIATVARTRVDRIAEEAARLLRPRTRGFYGLVLDEALGFLGSLVVNHARAWRTEQDFRDFAEENRGRAAPRDVARFVLEHAAVEARWLARLGAPPRVRTRDLVARASAARALGERLGALLHRGLLEGSVTRSLLREHLIGRTGRASYFALIRATRRAGWRLQRPIARVA